MTNNELKATAEYLSSLPQREDMSFESLARKAKNIADAYLARLAADDLGDSIDDAFKARIAELEEWRASRLTADEQQASEDAMFADDDWLSQQTRGMCWRLKWDCTTREVFLGETSIGIKRTRGQWRQLLEALKGGGT